MPVRKSRAIVRMERLPFVGSAVKKCYDPWLDLKYRVYKNYLINPRSGRSFEKQKPILSETQQRLVAELRQSGFAKVSFDELFSDSELMGLACKYASDFAASPEVKARSDAFRINNASSGPKDHVYMTRHFSEDQVISFDNPILRLGVNPHLLDVVNSYLGLWSKLKKIHLWFTYPSGADRSRTGPQNWHRDPEDQHMVTVFLYFTDVDEKSGPLEYIPTTRFGAERHNTWPHYGGSNHTSNPTLAEIEEITEPSERCTITCPPLTLLFCDTTGFHRGGYAIDKHRILAHWTYATPASLWPKRYKLDRRIDMISAEDPVKYALS